MNPQRPFNQRRALQNPHR